jgi:tripartite-type tricarboxylate transporter receptor subunit TctC
MEVCIMNGLRAVLACALTASCVVLGITPASAQSYPVRHVRIITAGAGGFHDIVARNLAQRLSERWGQPVVIENQPAAGLTIGTGMAAKAPADGYTLLLGDRTSLAAAPSLYKSLRYDPVKDLVPITLVARAPAMLAAHPSVPANNLGEFVAYVRKQTDPVHYASAGQGTFPHLTGVQFEQLVGAKLLTVQYKGGGDAAVALLRGEAKFSFLPIPIVLPQISAGKFKVFAVTSPGRFDGAPAVPTAIESGFPGLEAEQWVGMLAPAGTPAAIVEKLNRDIVEVLRTPALQDILRTQGATAAPGTPGEFASFMASETIRLRKLIEASRLAPL